MTNTVKIALSALAAVACLAGAAHAQDEVRISLAGKSPAAVRAEIVQAAAKVCADVDADNLFGGIDAKSRCVDETIVKAKADYALLASTQLALVEQPRR